MALNGHVQPVGVAIGIASTESASHVIQLIQSFDCHSTASPVPTHRSVSDLAF